MANEKKTGLSEEYLRKFRHRSGYVISESPKYHPLVSSSDEFDEMPELTTEAGEQEDPLKPQGQVPPAPSNDVPQGTDAPTPAPEFDAQGGAPPADGMPPEGDIPFDPMGAEGMPPATDGMPPAAPMGEPNPENQVDDIQNEIIKHNIEAMKGIQDTLMGLNQSIEGLNSKMNVLNADVEEVREPTDGEKLMNKTDVSYPYYFNLNDFWQDNWFDQKRVGENTEKGVKELPDGSFVADFDDLPQKSKIDVQDSFNDMV